MHSKEVSGVFLKPNLKRCHSEDLNGTSDIHIYPGETKKPRRSESGLTDVPEDLISLSFDLLNQIRQHENSSETSGYVSSPSYLSPGSSSSCSPVVSPEASEIMTVMTADSSSEYPYLLRSDGEVTQITDTADDGSVSSVDGGPTRGMGVCDSGRLSRASQYNKPLYTAELQVYCRICGDRASGFHYGVHSCEGCKGFFRRTLKKDLVYKPCRDNSQCRIDAGSRNKCQYCRYQKCINAGMSQNAVRFGRMPKVEREKLVADQEELQKSCTQRLLDLRTMAYRIRAAFLDSFSQGQLISNYLSQAGSSNVHVKADPENRFSTNSLDESEFFKHKLFSCFQEVIIPMIEGTVRFTKKIPNFPQLPMAERIAMLKQNCFCVPLTLFCLMYDDNTLYLNGKKSSMSISEKKKCYACHEAQCMFMGIFTIVRRLCAMKLKDVELAVFCAVLLLIESPATYSFKEVEDLQMELLNVLRLELKHNHPKDYYLFPRLLVLIPQLVQVSEEFRKNLMDHVFDHTDDLSETHDLLHEIFDLR